jgi:hypothetical protein
MAASTEFEPRYRMTLIGRIATISPRTAAKWRYRPRIDVQVARELIPETGEADIRFVAV